MLDSVSYVLMVVLLTTCEDLQEKYIELLD